MAARTSGTTIVGMAAVLPSGVLSNADLARRFGEREIASAIRMSGIHERRVAAAGEKASDLALTAAERLFQRLPFDRSRIDLLMFVSQTPDYRIPTTAAVLQGKLGLGQQCATFDVNQACSAFPYALGVAHGMISAGLARYALVLNADTLTSLIHPMDRSLITLHGDGACATILGPCPAAGYGIEGFALGTDGTGARYLMVPAGGCRNPHTADSAAEYTDGDGCTRTADHLRMDGPAVFHFSVYKVPAVIKDALAGLGLTLDDIDTVILHQANRTMLDLIYKSLRVPAEKRFYFLERTGNSSGPSSAIALFEAWRQGVVKPGSRTLICSFGAGLTWGVAVIRWPECGSPVIDCDPAATPEEVLSAAL